MIEPRFRVSVKLMNDETERHGHDCHSVFVTRHALKVKMYLEALFGVFLTSQDMDALSDLTLPDAIITGFTWHIGSGPATLKVDIHFGPYSVVSLKDSE